MGFQHSDWSQASAAPLTKMCTSSAKFDVKLLTLLYKYKPTKKTTQKQTQEYINK